MMQLHFAAVDTAASTSTLHLNNEDLVMALLICAEWLSLGSTGQQPGSCNPLVASASDSLMLMLYAQLHSVLRYTGTAVQRLGMAGVHATVAVGQALKAEP
jgi:hypothetical protein